MSKKPETLDGVFRHPVYSPRGEHEGVLLERRGEVVQLVFEHHDEEASRAFDFVTAGQAVSVEALPLPPSPKGEGEHPVLAFVRLVAVDGKKPVRPKPSAAGAAYQGKVLRLNYARHGAANGVVLDTGDFIHLKPQGMARLKLAVGDRVEADGDAQRLVDDAGWAVEATTVNGEAVEPH